MPEPEQNAKPQTVTMRDVARESGFSPTTVSITLNDAPLARYLPAETKAKIRQVARRLGYRPNPFARSLRNKRSHSIGVMVSDVTDPFCTLILRGIEGKLYQSSYVPVFTDTHNEAVRFERYLEMLLDRRVEGLIIVANWLFVEIDVLADIERHDIPTVLIGREFEKSSMSSITVDNQAGGTKAIEHLFGLGHRRIAFIRGPGILSDTDPRWKGVCGFASRAGLALDQDLVLDLPSSSNPASGFEGGFALAQELLRRGNRFSAIMAFDDMTALGAMRALAESGVRVPEDCSIIGFDDIAPAALCTPALTTVRQPMEEMGEIAAAIVVEGLGQGNESKDGAARSRKVSPELVIRRSTAAVSPE